MRNPFTIASLYVLTVLLTGCSHVRCEHCQHHTWALPEAPFPPLVGQYQPPPSSNRLEAVDDYFWVFLEGDGKPWAMRHIVAKNPTSQHKLALQLMLATPAEAVYINRPCYGLTDMSHCHPKWWTSHRYHHDIAKAINGALEQILLHTTGPLADPTHQPHQNSMLQKVIIVGHSGGGNLAMQVAAMRQDVAAVITLSANLDHARWTAYHGYSPLHGSTNIANTEPLPANIIHRHYVGTNDNNINMPMVSPIQQTDPHAQIVLLNSDHHGWLKFWPEIMASMVDALTQ